MATMVQSFPQQPGAVTMLQTRPRSASGILPSQSHASQQLFSAPNPQNRNSFHGFPAGPSPVLYRTAPVQPYAFTSTPSLNTATHWQQAASACVLPPAGTPGSGQPLTRAQQSASVSMTNLPATLAGPFVGSRDDSSLPVGSRFVINTPRPQSVYVGSTAHAPLPQVLSSPKPAPDRYRRPLARTESAPSVTQVSAHGGVLPVTPVPTRRSMPDHGPATATARNQSVSLPTRPRSHYGAVAAPSADDMHLGGRSGASEPRRLRRRSIHNINATDFAGQFSVTDFRRAEIPIPPAKKSPVKEPEAGLSRMAPGVPVGERPVHSRTPSSDSVVSSRSSSSRPSSAHRSSVMQPPTVAVARPDHASGYDSAKIVNIPPRASSNDAQRRVMTPSPLSKPFDADGDAGLPAQPPPPGKTKTESIAAQQLAAINSKGAKRKSRASRLRRALSFELRRAVEYQAHADATPKSNADSLQPPRQDEMYDAEQARIAQKQEENGLGSSIYSGGKSFSGSTDNLSISSTASSASIMIRKMGRGMKKGGRSLVGLFRPRSTVGTPTEEPLPEVSEATVSMVTVEAERDRVNVNLDPHDQPGGGTGFPRLERNSIDANMADSSSDRLSSFATDSSTRKSIVGGDKERAEVLAAVRKGILKNSSGTPSPSGRPGAVSDLPGVPTLTETPVSSAPSTPGDEPQTKRAGPVSLGSEDYFVTALRLRQDTKSSPATPSGSVKRNATFSHRIIFHDTWPSQEYDRRGEVATCNRLTPMLAQQIKEELNSFKMEMEVHESSKVYTQFF